MPEISLTIIVYTPSGLEIHVHNHLQRDFTAGKPNPGGGGHNLCANPGKPFYLHIVVDVYSGIVVGWSMSHCQDRQLVLQAVLMALW
jgi:putative transposase